MNLGHALKVRFWKLLEEFEIFQHATSTLVIFIGEYPPGWEKKNGSDDSGVVCIAGSIICSRAKQLWHSY